MHNKKRRSRTGCLTCRARRVKCDERVPECIRCTAANVACAGYEQQRVVPIKSQDMTRRQRQIASSPAFSHRQNLQQIQSPILAREGATSPRSSSSPFRSQSVTQDPNAIINTVHSPLVAFPSSPQLGQCPSLGARHVLGYHQVLLRTIPLLFPLRHLQFWRDELLQEAWGNEFLYLTLVALGNVHRAALMTVTGSSYDRTNSLDMKITAVQLYTQALQELSKNLEEVKQTPVLLVASLCLMAYFEAFSGNIPAFVGRVQAADHYLTMLLPARTFSKRENTPLNSSLQPLRDCLRSLGQTCYITLPLRTLHIATERHTENFRSETIDVDVSPSVVLATLQSLVNMVFSNHELKELVWSPIAVYARTMSAQLVKDFETKLVQWKEESLELIPELDTDSALSALLVYGWPKFALPPPPYPTTPRNKSLAAAHYNFYRGRMKWALVLLEDDVLQNKRMAEFYFYEALRHTASHAVLLNATDHEGENYIPCEALKTGILPVLHTIGLCSPRPLWLEWIKDLSDRIAQEGVLKGHTFATNLDCLHRFEMFASDVDCSTTLEKYPEPSERIICQLVPETDGRHFTSFFAAPSEAYDVRHTGLGAYRVIGHARWSCGYGEGPCTPVINRYDSNNSNLEPFSTGWLSSTQVALEWLSWSQEREFQIGRALRDHISGTRLLLTANNANIDKQL